MNKVTLLKGLPASGKSTWAIEQVLKSQGKIKRVNKDDLRKMIDSSVWSKNNERFIIVIRDSIIGLALMNGYDVIVDDTNFAPEHEHTIRAIAEANGAEFDIRLFDIDPDECVSRDTQRANPVGEKVIRDMYRRYLQCLNTSTPRAPLYQEGKPYAIICDIDGTLAHMNGKRGPFDWTKVGEDTLDDTVADLVRKYFIAGDEIIIVSGRDGICSVETVSWLMRNEIPMSAFFMRPTGDKRKDTDIKREIYENHIAGKYNIRFVLDDRDQVVKMWRELGLKCLQVAEGNF